MTKRWRNNELIVTNRPSTNTGDLFRQNKIFHFMISFTSARKERKRVKIKKEKTSETTYGYQTFREKINVKTEKMPSGILAKIKIIPNFIFLIKFIYLHIHYRVKSF